MVHSSFSLLLIPPELWNPICRQCPELQKHTRSSWNQRSTKEQKDTLVYMHQWDNAAAHFLHYRLCIPDLCSLCQFIFDIHRGHACLEFKGMRDNQSPVTKPDWQVVLQCSQPWEHAVNHSPHLLIIRTQGAGSYPTMYCARRKHSSLVTIHH